MTAPSSTPAAHSQSALDTPVIKLVRRASDAVNRALNRGPVTSSAASVASAVPANDKDVVPEFPKFLLDGVPMLKVSSKKKAQRVVRLLPELGQMTWQSNSLKAALLSAPGWAYLYLDSIIELRFGDDASAYLQQFGVSSEALPRWITIVYVTTSGDDRQIKMLHLIALQQDVANAWRQALTFLVDERKALMSDGCKDDVAKRWSLWTKQCWRTADANADDKVDLAETIALCKRLGIAASPADVERNFKEADQHSKGFLDFADFQAFVKHLRRRPEVDGLVQRLTGSTTSPGLTPAQFHKFLQIEQLQTAITDTESAALYAKFAVTEPTTFMSVEDFTNYLVSAENGAIDPKQQSICQDMTRPLCEYFVSSSHNVSHCRVCPVTRRRAELSS